MRTDLPSTALTGVAFSVCCLDDDSDLPHGIALALLSADEKARAGRFHFRRDADRFVRARGHLRQELARATGHDPATIDLEVGTYGKPRMRQTSTGPHLHFNLSHSGGLAVLAISDQPVGIDVELLERKLAPAELAPSVLTLSEQQALESSAVPDPLHLFLAMWTAKEARMKLTGEGVALDPRSISLDLRDGWPSGYLAPPGSPVHLGFPDINRPDAICAVARFASADWREVP